MTKRTLLLVFIHGFKGSANTFGRFPEDLANLLSHSLPKIAVKAVQYPPYDTRGDLALCVAKFREWLQNLVIELEVENGTRNPMHEPGVRVVLCGHSMGGIVAVEAVLSILEKDKDVVQEGYANDTTNSSATGEDAKAMEGGSKARKSGKLAVPDRHERASSAPPAQGEPVSPFFPHIQAVLAFDTPYLGISPGVLAHGAEEHLNQASSAYKAFGTASDIFGWNSPRSASPQPIANASSKGLPAPSSDGAGWGTWGKYAMYGGAAAALAGAAGAAYMNRNQISQGLSWAGSHLEFIGCLARGAELQQRIEKMVALEQARGVGFGNFYGALSQQVAGKTKWAGAAVGKDRTFCVIPTPSPPVEKGSPTGTKRSKPSSATSKPAPPAKKRKQDVEDEKEMAAEMEEGEEVDRYAKDLTKDKGNWVKCVNAVAQDEVTAHRSMFNPPKNPDYHAMVSRSRDWLDGVVDKQWYEASSTGEVEGEAKSGAVVKKLEDGKLEGEVEMLGA
ncbi:hypothetical protein LTR78_000612 [Recurvomyces mirabilis]|uniref:DUF676 domain-containing protein n=1 Tax=Recurvomyces mirabilis TaxID=574656 RepID=A0AAE0WY52_9PEZI|nr:hypothetical protein LTR78_000612 [Recurvomyces mirabilis]KAK5162266.1 hypothetical protein LTS14_000613 [Recurvomyces mirabilis]